MMKPDEEWGLMMRQMGQALAIPGLLAAGPLVGYGLGWCAVEYLGWPGWVKSLGLLFGLVSGIRETILVIRKLSEESRDKGNE